MIFKKLEPYVILPIKMHKTDCGYDCFLPEDIIIKAHEVKKIDLKVSIKLKKNECAIICARSSIAIQNIICNTSPIDCGYNGPVHAIVHNISNNDMLFKSKDRICQIVIFNIPFKKERFISKAKRNNGSFGSSGKN